MTTSFPQPSIVSAGGINLAIYERDGDPARRRPPIILVHGWPEIAYSWKNVMPSLADAGFRVIALDLKGFGRSQAPTDKRLYDIEHMTSDLAALLDALDIEKAVFCGHDWGGAIVWPMAQLHPTRVVAVIGVSTPHRAPAPISPLTILKERYSEQHYIVRFQEEEIPERIFARDPARFFQLLFRRPPFHTMPAHIDNRVFDIISRFENGPAPDQRDIILSDKDLAIFIDAYKRSGFAGGINLYRNIERNWEFMKTRNPVIPHPALWIGADCDIFLPLSGADDMEKLVPNVEKHVIADCGHWVMWERPEELNAILTNWLSRTVFS